MKQTCTKCGTNRVNPFTRKHQCASNPPGVANTLSEETRAELAAKIEATNFKTVYRGCKVSEETFRRAMKGGPLSQSTHRLMTTYAKGGTPNGGKEQPADVEANH